MCELIVYCILGYLMCVYVCTPVCFQAVFFIFKYSITVVFLPVSRDVSIDFPNKFECPTPAVAAKLSPTERRSTDVSEL